MTYCALDQVESYLRQYIAYPHEHAVTAHVLWIAHTHLFDEMDTTPRLAFMSAEKRSGKTRCLEAMSPLVPGPSLWFSPSPAAMIRLIHGAGDERRTIMTDEIDSIFGREKATDGAVDLRTALNAGYRRGATFARCAPNTFKVEEMNAFAPVCVAGIGELPDTLADRAIIIRMKRRAKGETVKPLKTRYIEDEAKPVREELIEWCDWAAGRLPLDPPMPVEDRAADIWEPLIRIADAAGDDWPERARAAAAFFTDANADMEARTDGIDLLEHIRDAFLESDKIWTSTLIDRLVARDESPWDDVRGKPITDRGIAEKLRPYGVRSKDVWITGTTRKGYTRDQFVDLWERYLPPRGDEGDGGEEIDNKDKKLADLADGSPTQDRGHEPPG